MVDQLKNANPEEARRRAAEAMQRMREQQAEAARQRAAAQLAESKQTTEPAGKDELTKDAFMADPKVAEELGLSQDQLAKAFDDAAKLDGKETMNDQEIEALFVSLSQANTPLPAPSVIKEEAPVEKPKLDETSQAIQDGADKLGDAIVAQNKFQGELIDGAANWVGEKVVEGGKLQADQQNQLLDQAGKDANTATQAVGNYFGGMLDSVGLTGAGQSVRDAASETGQVLESVADTAGDVAKWKTETESYIAGKAIDMVGDVAKGVLQTTGEIADVALDLGATVLTEGTFAAAEKAADKAIGKEIPAYKGQIDGFTGILTNRLDRGEAVMIKGEGNVEIGAVGLYGNAKTTGAATMGRDADGNITIKVEVAQEVEGGVKAEFGFEGQIGSVEIGASGEAKAGIVGQTGAAVTLKFNPNNPADVARLKALIEPKGDQTSVAGLNPANLSLDPKALQEAVTTNFDSVEITSAVGIRGSASVEGEAATVSAMLGLSAEGFLGSKIKINADGSKETTVFMRGEGTLEGGLSEGTSNISAGGKYTREEVRSYTITESKEGKVTNITDSTSSQVSKGFGVTQNLGEGAGRNVLKERQGNKTLGDTFENNGAGGTAERGNGVTTTVSEKLNDAGQKLLAERLEKGEAPITAYNALMKAPANKVTETVTSTSNQFSYGFGATVSLGAVKVGLGTKVTVAKTKDVTQVVDGSKPNAEPGNTFSPIHRDNVADIY